MNSITFHVLALLSLQIIFLDACSNQPQNVANKVSLTEQANLLYKTGKEYAEQANTYEDDEKYEEYKKLASDYYYKAYKLGHQKAFYKLRILNSGDWDIDPEREGIILTLNKAIKEYPNNAEYWSTLGYFLAYNHNNIAYALQCHHNAYNLKKYVSAIPLGRIYLSKNFIKPGLFFMNKAIESCDNLTILKPILEILAAYFDSLNSNKDYIATLINGLQKKCILQRPNDPNYFNEVLRSPDWSFLKEYLCLGNI